MYIGFWIFTVMLVHMFPTNVDLAKNNTVIFLIAQAHTKKRISEMIRALEKPLAQMNYIGEELFWRGDNRY